MELTKGMFPHHDRIYDIAHRLLEMIEIRQQFGVDQELLTGYKNYISQGALIVSNSSDLLKKAIKMADRNNIQQGRIYMLKYMLRLLYTFLINYISVYKLRLTILMSIMLGPLKLF